MGLEINENETKFMKMGENREERIENKKFIVRTERYEKYLVTSKEEEIKVRIVKWNMKFGMIYRLMHSKHRRGAEKIR